MRVLVTDGDQRTALAVTRSLVKRGITVRVGEEKSKSLASVSKYCSEQIAYPSPYQDAQAFTRFMLEFVRKARIDLILPITDVTTHFVSRDKKQLEPYARTAVPDFEAFDFVSNKLSLLRQAQEFSIPIPRTWFCDKPAAVKEVLRQLPFPVVVKAGRSRILTERGWLFTNVHYADSEAELLRLYADKEYLQYPSLIQERITGPGVGLFLLFDHGELVTAFSHKRLREKPPSGGVSTLRESIPVNAELKEHAIKLFTRLRWHGVAMMEYKLDRVTARPFLIEVNGRFWGSLQLAIDAGVDFPYLVYRLATEGHVEPPAPYTVGVKSRWLLGDLDHLGLRLFKRDEDLHLPARFPSRRKTFFQFLKLYEPGLHYEILSATDPRPFVYELSQYVQGIFRKMPALT